MTNVKPDQAALTKRPLVKKAVSVEAFVFLLLFFGFWAVLGHKMGTVNLMSTLMNTAYDLLISTVFYIMAISTTIIGGMPSSDNNAFKRYFKKYQVPPLTNIGTSFGMGLVIIAFMVGVKSPVGESFVSAAPRFRISFSCNAT